MTPGWQLKTYGAIRWVSPHIWQEKERANPLISYRYSGALESESQLFGEKNVAQFRIAVHFVPAYPDSSTAGTSPLLIVCQGDERRYLVCEGMVSVSFPIRWPSEDRLTILTVSNHEFRLLNSIQPATFHLEGAEALRMSNSKVVSRK